MPFPWKSSPIGTLMQSSWINSSMKVSFVLGGPLEGSVDVLLILRATSIEEIERRLSNDPWRRSGLLVAKQCWPWRLRLGTLA